MGGPVERLLLEQHLAITKYWTVLRHNTKQNVPFSDQV